MEETSKCFYNTLCNFQITDKLISINFEYQIETIVLDYYWILNTYFLCIVQLFLTVLLFSGFWKYYLHDISWCIYYYYQRVQYQLHIGEIGTINDINKIKMNEIKKQFTHICIYATQFICLCDNREYRNIGKYNFQIMEHLNNRIITQFLALWFQEQFQE